MATERQPLDAVISSSGVTGATVANLQDDPDTPDGNWAVATGNNTDTEVYVSFGTPTGNPNVGADLQEFRAYVRQFDTGQTGNPNARLELWENGTIVRAGSEVSITGAGQVIALTWNANEIGTADGSLVEAKIIGTKSGGSPGARNTVDFGAIEWNVDYSATTTYFETPAMSGTGTASLSSFALFPLTLASAATGTLTLAKLISKTLSNTATGTLTLAKMVQKTLSSAATGAASLVHALLFTVSSAASAVGTATLNTALVIAMTLASAATGTASLSRTLIISSLAIITSITRSITRAISGEVDEP